MVTGRPQYRLLIAAGRIVHAVSVVGQLAPDGAVELIGIDIDVTSPWGDPDEPDDERQFPQP